MRKRLWTILLTVFVFLSGTALGLSTVYRVDTVTVNVTYVTAEAQAEAFGRIEEMLLEDEQAVFRRAYNSTHLNKPKHAAISVYRTATGFEAVVGMLYYLGDEERLNELLNIAHGDNDQTRE